MPNNEKKAEWWSTNGVPLDGYAKIEKKIEYIKQYFISKLKFLTTKKVAKVKIAFNKEECNK